MGYPRLTEEYKADIWERYANGQSAAVIARGLGRHPVTVAEFIRDAGGIRPARVCRSEVHLSLSEREEISRGLAGGESLRMIARLETGPVNDQSGGGPQRRAAPLPSPAGRS